MKRAFALLLTIVLLVTGSGTAALAEGSASNSALTTAALINWILTKAAQAAGTKAINWGLDSFYAMTFGANQPDDGVASKLEALLESNEAISRHIDKLDHEVVSSSLLSEINGFVKWTWQDEGQIAFNALKDIDQELAKAKKDAEAIKDPAAKAKALADAADIAAQDRKNTLLYVIPKRQAGLKPTGSISDFDTRAITYAQYLLTRMRMANGDFGTLFDMYYESVRLSGNYKWENQAYEEILEFEANALAGFVAAATVDKLSLCARIEEIDEWNAAHPKDRASAAVLKQQLAKLDDYIKKISTIQVIQERTSDRYYWVPGHEMVFYLAKKTPVPQDNPKKGTLNFNRYEMTKEGPQGALRARGEHGSLVNRPYAPFWKPVTTYNGKNQQLITYDQLATIYNDYGGKKTLYDIFFGDAAMPKIPGADNSWSFVIRPSDAYPLYYCGRTFSADSVEAHMVRNQKTGGSLDKPHLEPLVYYHFKSSEMPKSTNYISIGIKQPTVSDPMDETALVASTQDDDRLTWDGNGPMEVSFGDPNDVVAYTIEIDGVTVSPKSMTMEETTDACTITIARQALAGLATGQHKLTATFQCREDGSIQCSYDFIVTNAMPATGDGFPVVALAGISLACLMALLWLWNDRRRVRG